MISNTQKLEVLEETTPWSGKTPNHTYVIRNDMLIGYIKVQTNELVKLTPKFFDKRTRSFKKITGPLVQDIFISL